MTVYCYYTSVYLLCFRCLQGKFRLKKNKPKQEQEVATGQPKPTNSTSQSKSETDHSESGKQQDQEELPDLNDPDVQKVTMKLQVQDAVGRGYLLP